MTITFTLTTLAAFAIWNESYRLRLYISDLINTINSTFGSSNAIYRNIRQPQKWMK